MARHRKHRRRRHSNPFSPSALISGPKQMLTKEFAIEAVSVAAGFIVPGIAMNYIPATFRDSKVKYYIAKVGTIALLSAAASMVSKKASRMFLLGGGVSLLLDIWTEFKAATTPMAAKPAGTGYYYGGMHGTDMYYGPGIGDDLVLSDSDEF